jgi:hypothetical protein
MNSGGIGSLGSNHGVFHLFETGKELVDKFVVFHSERDSKGRGTNSVQRRSSLEAFTGCRLRAIGLRGGRRLRVGRARAGRGGRPQR